MSFCKEFNAKTAGFLVSDQYFHDKRLQRKSSRRTFVADIPRDTVSHSPKCPYR